MNLRLEAILKKEKNLYKDITSNLKGKNFAELNGGLAETIAKLLERKALIEQLNQEVLEDEAREALYERIEDNNKYFAEEVDRDDIHKQFMRADDSYAKSAEWQNLHMAFLSTASVASYKAVDTFNDNLKDLRNRREEIREGLKATKKDIAKAQSIDPTTNPDNAKEQVDKYTKEKDKLKNEFLQKDSENDKAKNIYFSDYKNYKKHKSDYEFYNDNLKNLLKLQEEVKKDSAYKRLCVTPEQFDKLINEQKALLNKREEEKANAIANVSTEYKSYFEATYTEEEKEKLAYLEDFEKIIRYGQETYGDKGAAVVKHDKKTGKTSVDNFDATLSTLLSTLQYDQRIEKKERFALIDKFDGYLDRLYNILPKDDNFTMDSLRAFTYPVALEKIANLRKEIDEQLNARKTEIFNALSDEEKNLISPSEETIEDEKKIKDNIKKLEENKDKIANRTQSEFNEEYNKLINRKIKELKYEIKGIANKDLWEIKGDQWFEDKIKNAKELITKAEVGMKKTEDSYKKYVAIEEKFKPTKDAYEKDNAEYNKKIAHAKQMIHPEWNFNFDKYKKALNKNCKDVPKLDLKALMEQKQVAGFALYQMTEEYKGNHNDSPEFAAMKASMAYVMNWGTDNAIPPTYPNAPKTFEEAITQLKENCKKYVEAKNDQKRPFPSKMRHLRFQIAKAFDMYADTQRESLKDFQMTEELADKWNKYFEVKTKEKDALEQKNELGIPNVQTDIKKEEIYKDEFYKDEQVLEADEMTYAR